MLDTFKYFGYGSPLGPTGPLSSLGPLTEYQVYNVMYHLLHIPWNANDFAVNLDLVGVWGILGPLGARSLLSEPTHNANNLA